MTLKVNGEAVDSKEIDAEVERLRGDYDRYVREANEQGGDEQLRKWSRENVIERLLIRQEAAVSDVQIPQKEIEETFENAKDQFKALGMKKKAALAEIERQLKAEKLIADVTADIGEPTDDEIRAFYDENQDQFIEPEQVAVRHIEKRVTDPQQKTAAYVELLNLHERIKKGEKFEDLAAQFSDCSSSDIGYFPRGQMVDEFEAVVFALEKDEVSEVFLTPFGYHIAKVYDKRSGGPVPLDAVRDSIRERLTKEKKDEAVETFIDKLRAKAVIEG